ncbi:MAG: LNS2 domain-containing protein [Burkholderiales bacterium]
MRAAVLLASALALSACTQLSAQPIAAPAAKGSQAVVFDIDGTLTPEVLLIDEARIDAAAATRAFADKGYTILYVTTRIPGFQSGLPAWLASNGFASGRLHVAQTSEERSNPQVYKADILARYEALGWRLSYAYGDSTTDFEAYAAAGIPRQHVFALKRRNASDCQPGAYAQCLDRWTGHLSYIRKEVPDAR